MKVELEVDASPIRKDANRSAVELASDRRVLLPNLEMSTVKSTSVSMSSAIAALGKASG